MFCRYSHDLDPGGLKTNCKPPWGLRMKFHKCALRRQGATIKIKGAVAVFPSTAGMRFEYKTTYLLVIGFKKNLVRIFAYVDIGDKQICVRLFISLGGAPVKDNVKWIEWIQIEQ